MQAHDIAGLFVQHLHLRPGGPLVERSVTTEIEWPFRSGACLIIKFFPGHALVLGRWSETLDEETAVKRALGAREEVMWDEYGALFPRYGRTAHDGPPDSDGEPDREHPALGQEPPGRTDASRHAWLEGDPE